MKPAISILAICFCISAFAQNETALRRRNYNHDNYLALKEFDPVSYFKGSKPVKGSSNFSYTHQGIIYYFSSEANRAEFKKSPAKYEPAYGGWCAYSMAQDARRERVSPVTYKIVGGKLYLFSNFNGNNTMLLWNRNERKYKEAADNFWKKKWGGG